MKQSDFLKADILQAYDELGGIDYLYENPALMERILLRMLKQQAPLPALTVVLSEEAPWIDFSQRLAYKTESRENTTDVAFRETSAPTPWKRLQDTAENRLQDDIDKLSS